MDWWYPYAMRKIHVSVLLLLSCDLAPTIGSVLDRADVPKIIECAQLSGLERAECLGAEALTTGLDVACDRAAALAKQGAEAPASDRRLGGKLDAALAEVAQEVEATKANGSP